MENPELEHAEDLVVPEPVGPEEIVEAVVDEDEGGVETDGMEEVDGPVDDAEGMEEEEEEEAMEENQGGIEEQDGTVKDSEGVDDNEEAAKEQEDPIVPQSSGPQEAGRLEEDEEVMPEDVEEEEGVEDNLGRMEKETAATVGVAGGVEENESRSPGEAPAMAEEEEEEMQEGQEDGIHEDAQGMEENAQSVQPREEVLGFYFPKTGHVWADVKSNFEEQHQRMKIGDTLPMQWDHTAPDATLLHIGYDKEEVERHLDYHWNQVKAARIQAARERRAAQAKTKPKAQKAAEDNYRWPEYDPAIHGESSRSVRASTVDSRWERIEEDAQKNGESSRPRSRSRSCTRSLRLQKTHVCYEEPEDDEEEEEQMRRGPVQKKARLAAPRQRVQVEVHEEQPERVIYDHAYLMAAAVPIDSNEETTEDENPGGRAIRLLEDNPARTARIRNKHRCEAAAELVKQSEKEVAMIDEKRAMNREKQQELDRDNLLLDQDHANAQLALDASRRALEEANRLEAEHEVRLEEERKKKEEKEKETEELKNREKECRRKEEEWMTKMEEISRMKNEFEIESRRRQEQFEKEKEELNKREKKIEAKQKEQKKEEEKRPRKRPAKENGNSPKMRISSTPIAFVASQASQTIDKLQLRLHEPFTIPRLAARQAPVLNPYANVGKNGRMESGIAPPTSPTFIDQLAKHQPSDKVQLNMHEQFAMAQAAILPVYNPYTTAVRENGIMEGGTLFPSPHSRNSSHIDHARDPRHAKDNISESNNTNNPIPSHNNNDTGRAPISSDGMESDKRKHDENMASIFGVLEEFGGYKGSYIAR